MSKTVMTKSGTHLPLTNLKGKDYLMIAYRLQWLTEDVKNYTINTELLTLTDEQTVAKSTVTIFDDTGKVVRQAQATKRETKKDFSDHTEKAETAAIGRALAMLGFGTQHALSDLDEGTRLADSPLESAKPARTLGLVTSPVNTAVTLPTTDSSVTTVKATDKVTLTAEVVTPSTIINSFKEMSIEPVAPAKRSSFRKPPKTAPVANGHAPSEDI